MVPTLFDRLACVERALEDVIIPAIRDDEALAIEQAQLSLHQLRILRARIDSYPAEEEQAFGEAQALADRLEKIVRAPAASPQMREETDLAAARENRVTLLQSIDAMIATAFSADPDDLAAVQTAVIAYQRQRRPSEDRWFSTE